MCLNIGKDQQKTQMTQKRLKNVQFRKICGHGTRNFLQTSIFCVLRCITDFESFKAASAQSALVFERLKPLGQ